MFKAPHEAKIMWYINDEVGSMIAHSDSPNCRMAPVYFKGTTYTLLWPIKDIDHEGITAFAFIYFKECISNMTSYSK